nr:MAG: internal scaffolding protein [Microviridae sp.]
MHKKQNRVFQTRSTGDKIVRTQQHFGPECDINVMVARYKKTGKMGGENPETPPQYVDTTAFTEKSFEESFEEVQKMQQTFNQLPAAIRAQFNHNPARLLAFLENPANRQAGIQLGLLEPPKRPKTEAQNQKSTSHPLDVTGTSDTNPPKKGSHSKKTTTIIEEE